MFTYSNYGYYMLCGIYYRKEIFLMVREIFLLVFFTGFVGFFIGYLKGKGII